MVAPAHATVTMLFTDIEDSTPLAERLGDVAYRDVLAEHLGVVRQAVEGAGGRIVDSTGDGILGFLPTAEDGVRAALAAQRRLVATGSPARSRIAVHTGTTLASGDEFVGVDIHAAARIMALGHGGQVLVSEPARVLVGDATHEGWSFRDLGLYALRGIAAPVRIFQLDAAGVASEFPPLRDSADRRDVPLAPGPIVGRERELALAADLLDTNRLLTITGPGGTGKTRLAIELARSVALRKGETPVFVDLASIHDEEAAVTATARALRVGGAESTRTRAAIADRVRQSPVLLVLDNLEQIAAGPSIVADLLAMSNAMRILATSRTPLHLREEQELPLNPLDVPPSAAAGSADVATAPAVRLFVDRARRASPSFELGADAAAVAEIVRRLDGLPLAIELVASRVRLLPPAAILERLGSVLDLAGPLDLPDRQRTLRQAIGWSCALLSPDVRRSFGRLGVFAGGWKLDAAEAVLGDEMPEAVDVLEALADRALVRPEPEVGRFSMLGTIGAYAEELLRSDPDRTAVRDRHARWTVRFVEDVRPRLLGSEQSRWLQALELELGNIRQALGYLHEDGDVELGLRLGTALLPFGQVRTPFRREFRRGLESFLAMPRAGADTRVVAHALGAASQYALWDDDRATAEARALESRDLFGALGDSAGVADQLASLGYALMEAQPHRAREQLMGALDTYRGIGGHEAEGFVLEGLALVAARIGDVASARRWSDEAAEQGARHLPPGHYYDGFTKVSVGRAAQLEGDLVRARELFVKALGIFRALDASAGVSLAISNLANLAMDVGRPDTGAALATLAAVVIESSEPFGGVISGIGNPLDRARPLLDPGAFEVAVRRGRAMTIDEASAEAVAAIQ